MTGKITYTPFISKTIPESKANAPIPIAIYRRPDPKEDVTPTQYTIPEPDPETETPIYSPTSQFQWARLVLNSGSTPAQKVTTPTVRPGGSHVFKTPDIKVGNMQDFLDVLAKNNIYIRVTSGIRPGAVTSSGNRSRHDDGHAIDITPIEGETWEDLVNKIRNCPEVLDYMVTHNVGWLEEISAEDQKKYDASNANIHVSIAGTRGYGEASAINGRKKTFGV